MSVWVLVSALAFAAPPPLQLPLDAARPVRAALTLSLDPAAATFSGEETLVVRFERGASELRLNALDLQISAATVGGAPARVEDGGAGTVVLRFPRVAAGEVPLTFAWTGAVSDLETQGVFRQREGDDWYLFTQFEATDARRMFPSFDQPDAKIPWTVTLLVPDGLLAAANAPQVATVDLPGPTTRVTFAETRPISSYLVAMAVGPFEAVDAGTAGRNHTPVRILAPRGEAGWAGYAAASTPALLGLLEEWFDLPYPFEKLDVVALPEAVGFGAMENPGLITCVQAYALARPEDDSEGRRRGYADVIAHEMAHLWFGDLVTMAWWDDLWLNESFASWMGAKVVDQWQPEWHGDVGRVVRRNSAMDADSLVSARRIREPIRSAEDIESAFDAITYDKGEAVLAMFEGWLGEATFRRGVHDYLVAHAYGNATADDFAAAMSGAAGFDVGGVFSGFLDQPGVPAVSLTSAGAGYVAAQSRYLPAGTGAKGKPRWQIPVSVRWEDASGAHAAAVLVSAKSQAFPLPGAAGDVRWLLPNAGATGYYRSAIDAESAAILLDPATPLTLPERVGVLGDANAAVAAGSLEAAVVLNRLPPLIALGDPLVVGQTVPVVAALDANLVPDDLRPNYDRMILALYGATAAELGVTPREGESADARQLRPALVALVGGVAREPMMVAAAQARADQWLTDRTGLDGDLVDVVLAVACRDGDRALFDRVLAEARRETDRDRRGHLLTALGAFRAPELTEAAFGVAIGGEFDVREAFGLVFAVVGGRDTRETGWRYAQAHLDEVSKSLPAIARGYLPYLASGFCDTAHRDAAEAFFRPRVKAWIGGGHMLDQVVEAVGVCAASRERQEPAVRAVLSGY